MFNQGVITFGGSGGSGGGITSINSATGPAITFAGREGIYVNRVSNTIYVGQDLASSGFATYDSLHTSGYIRNVDFVSSGFVEGPTIVNKTGGTLFQGTVVYVSGAQGNRAQGWPASYLTEEASDDTIGVVQSDIANNAEGPVTIAGELAGIDTSSWSAGDVLYVGVSGNLQNTKPVQPLHTVKVGYALNSTNNGKILVHIEGDADMHSLHDVQNIPATQQGEMLMWDTVSGLYRVGQIVGSGGTNVWADGQTIQVAGGGGSVTNNYTSSGVANRAEWFLAEYNSDQTSFDHAFLIREPLNITEVLLYGNSPSGTTTLGVSSGFPGESPTPMYSSNPEPNISGLNQVSSGLLPDNVVVPQGALLYVTQTNIDATASGIRFSVIFNNSISGNGSGITSINSESGPAVSIVGGHGTEVTTSTNQVKIEVSGGASSPLHSVDYNISGPLATVSGFDNGQFFTKAARIIDVVAYGDSPNGDTTLSLSKGYSGVAPTPIYTSATKPIINGTKAVTSGFLPDVTDIGAEEILYANVEGVASNASGVRLVVYYENIDESIFVMGGVANRNIDTKTTDYTLDSGDDVILANASSAALVMTLPSASGANQEGKVYDIKKTDSTSNNVTVSGVQNIDGALTAVLSLQYEAITVISNGTQWWII